MEVQEDVVNIGGLYAGVCGAWSDLMREGWNIEREWTRAGLLAMVEFHTCCLTGLY